VAWWPWLRAKYGFSDTQIRKYTFNLAPFLVDKNAIQEGYLSSEPYSVEKQAKFKPQVFLLADNGYPGYSNMVLVPGKWIQGNPQAVQAFVRATAQGWKDYLFGDAAPANKMIKAHNNEMSDDLIRQAIAKMKSYGIVVSGDATVQGIGAMSDAKWKTFFDTMVTDKLYDKSLPFKKAYDLRFIRNVHIK
jgi:NitT/TauT family transport system substrate-binding protein